MTRLPRPRRLLEMSRRFRQVPTPAEAVLWELLRGRRLDGLKFRRQHVVAGFIVDFYCAEQRLVIEVDGPVHGRYRSADAARVAILGTAGRRVLRLANDTVLHDLPSALATIRRAAGVPHPPGPLSIPGEGERATGRRSGLKHRPT